MIFTKKQEEMLLARIKNTILNDDELSEQFKKLAVLEEYHNNLHEDFITLTNQIQTQRDSDETNQLNLESVQQSIITKLDQININNDVIQTRLTEIEHFLNIKNAAKNSKNPWAEIVATDYDQQTGQLRTTVDWNDAFIQSLISHGFRGKSDNEIIGQWLTSLYHNFSGNDPQ